MNNIQSTYIKTVPLLLIPSLFTNLFPGKVTVIQVLCYYPLYFVYWRYFIRNKFTDIKGRLIVSLFLCYSIVLGIRAIGNITGFYDFKRFIGLTIFWYFFFPLIPYIINRDSFSVFIKKYIKYGIPSFVFVYVVLFFNEKPADANIDLPHMMSGFLFLLFFAHYMPPKYKLWLIVMVLISLFSDLSVRSNIANVGAALLIYLARVVIRNRNIFRAVAKLSYIIIALFVSAFSYLGASGVFNIFQIGDLLSVSYEVGGTMKGEREIMSDSRTIVYEDVWNGLGNNKAYIWGLGGDGRVDTYLVNSDMGGEEDLKGRPWQESGMLNMVQWGGLVGGVIYGLFFAVSAFLAIWKSKNSFMICIGIFIIYKLLFSFIEDPHSCSISYFLLIVFVSLGYQKWFLNATDEDIRQLTNELKDFRH